MKSLFITTLFVLCLLPAISFAGSHHTKGYFKKDGTYVTPHYQTNPDSNPYNNYSSKPNINPYTGQAGTVDPQQVQPRRKHRN